MVETILVLKFFVSLAIGILMGIEREWESKKYGIFAGLRTFAIASLLGTVCAYAAELYGPWILLIGFGGIVSLVAVEYLVSSYTMKKTGMTTEIAFIFSFLLGALVYTTGYEVPIILSVIITVFLASKKWTRQFALGLKEVELMDTLKFLILAFVILPLLPNRTLDPFQVLNPYMLWLLVVFISGLSFIGYILMKIWGARLGLPLSGAVGGLVSSTVVTLTMSADVKRNAKILNPAAFAVIIASSTMFLRILVLVLATNQALFSSLLIPMLGMALAGFALGYYLWKKRDHTPIKLELQSPLTLGPALKFAILFAFILLLSKIAQINFGTVGIYGASMVSGLADVDAITLSMATLAFHGEITNKVAVIALTLAAITNTLVKAFIAYLFGTKEFGRDIIKIFLVISAVGIIASLIF